MEVPPYESVVASLPFSLFLMSPAVRNREFQVRHDNQARLQEARDRLEAERTLKEMAIEKLNNYKAQVGDAVQSVRARARVCACVRV